MDNAGPRSILVVDEDQELRESVRDSLGRLGGRVSVAGSAVLVVTAWRLRAG